jgi:hypothetical protein
MRFAETLYQYGNRFQMKGDSFSKNKYKINRNGEKLLFAMSAVNRATFD